MSTLSRNLTCANWSCSVRVNLDPFDGAAVPDALSVKKKRKKKFFSQPMDPLQQQPYTKSTINKLHSGALKKKRKVMLDCQKSLCFVGCCIFFLPAWWILYQVMVWSVMPIWSEFELKVNLSTKYSICHRSHTTTKTNKARLCLHQD